MSARSKTDPSLTKAEPINSGGSTFVIDNIFKKTEKTVVQQQLREKSEHT